MNPQWLRCHAKHKTWAGQQRARHVAKAIAPAWRFEEETARQALLEQFEVETLAAFGCDQLPQAVRAAGALVQYLRETQRATLPQLVSLHVYSTDEFMTLDQATRRR